MSVLQMLNPMSLLSYHFASKRVRGFHQMFKRSMLLKTSETRCPGTFIQSGRFCHFDCP